MIAIIKNLKAWLLKQINSQGEAYFFIYGFLFMVMVTSLLRCVSFGGDDIFDKVNTSIQEVKIDYEGIKNAGNQIEKLLANKDLEAINEFKFSDANDPILNTPYTEQELEELSKAFKKRKLTAATSLFAEYTYTIDGEDYTMTMGCDSEGNWRLVRF